MSKDSIIKNIIHIKDRKGGRIKIIKMAVKESLYIYYLHLILNTLK